MFRRCTPGIAEEHPWKIRKITLCRALTTKQQSKALPELLTKRYVRVFAMRALGDFDRCGQSLNRIRQHQGKIGRMLPSQFGRIRHEPGPNRPEVLEIGHRTRRNSRKSSSSMRLAISLCPAAVVKSAAGRARGNVSGTKLCQRRFGVPVQRPSCWRAHVE